MSCFDPSDPCIAHLPFVVLSPTFTYISPTSATDANDKNALIGRKTVSAARHSAGFCCLQPGVQTAGLNYPPESALADLLRQRFGLPDQYLDLFQAEFPEARIGQVNAELAQDNVRPIRPACRQHIQVFGGERCAFLPVTCEQRQYQQFPE